MAPRVIVHVGQQKSGTTYLQEVFAHSVAELAAAGVVYPVAPAGHRQRGIENHEWPTYGLLGVEYPWVTAERAAQEHDSWKTLSQQVSAASGTVLLSAEALSVIRSPAIRLFLDRLGVDDVEVVVTARSLRRSLPSLWQQHVRNGRLMGFDRYLEMLDRERRLPAERIEEDRDLHLWRAFAIGRLVRRWAAEVGTSRVRVVTSPGAPPRLLWSRFAEAIGVPALADLPPSEVLSRRVHTGLTAPEAVVLASVNAALERADWDVRSARRLRELILNEGFSQRDDRGPKIALPPRWSAQVAQWSAEDLTDLRQTGVTVVGDLNDLSSDPDDGDHRSPTPDEIGAAGAAAVLAAASKVPPAPTRPEKPRRRIRA
jgi:hypothetical protein